MNIVIFFPKNIQNRKKKDFPASSEKIYFLPIAKGSAAWSTA